MNLPEVSLPPHQEDGSVRGWLAASWRGHDSHDGHEMSCWPAARVSSARHPDGIPRTSPPLVVRHTPEAHTPLRSHSCSQESIEVNTRRCHVERRGGCAAGASATQRTESRVRVAGPVVCFVLHAVRSSAIADDCLFTAQVADEGGDNEVGVSGSADDSALSRSGADEVCAVPAAFL